MTNGSSLPSEQDRYTRVGREIDLLREHGYQADTKASPPYHVVTVQTQRSTEAGPQPVTIYFALDPGFPNSVPIMEIRLASSQLNPDGEVRDFMIDLDTKKRVEWNGASHLYQIVEDIHSAVQDEKNLRMKYHSLWPIASPVADPAVPPVVPPTSHTEPLLVPQPAPTVWPKNRLLIASAVLLGVVVIALAIFLINRPPSTQQQITQLWQQVSLLEGAYTPQSMEQLVGLLDQIRNLDPLARSADNQIAVDDLLVQARIKWGDLLYPRERAAAAAQYQAARALDGTNALVADRLAWIERGEMVRTASIVTWPEEIDLLRQAVAQNPNQRDPDNKSIKEWLYQAYVSYGQALVANPDDLRQANLALQQAEAGIALATEIGNEGAAAKELKLQAESRIAANSKYQFIVEPQAQAAWDTLLAEHEIAPKQADRSVNLLVLAPNATTLTLLGPHVGSAPGTSTPITASRTGEAAAALEPGSYTLQLQDGDRAIQTDFTVSAGEPYMMVRVIDRL